MRVKICGITTPEQGSAIAQLGATALGFICVPQSPRYVLPEQIRTIIEQLPNNPITGGRVDCIGVFANAALEIIQQTAQVTQLTGIQLHGDETPDFCAQVQHLLPDVEVIKALRLKELDALERVEQYRDSINTLLLDAYHPTQLGGTGKTLNWQILQKFQAPCPWFLAGGLTPENILTALTQVKPDGIDLSSGLEHSPGNKDLKKVVRLFEKLRDSQ
ncbi:MAG: phosphoribosylanthranilate isomerase [Cyanothece sp. SIO1E1]|nr:phosphoribosylanthranilate isomerase [Cyanothece sp. SIO1E1]